MKLPPELAGFEVVATPYLPDHVVCVREKGGHRYFDLQTGKSFHIPDPPPTFYRKERRR